MTAFKNIFSQVFSVGGDGGGETNMAQDFSAESGGFKITPIAPNSLAIRRINFVINGSNPLPLPPITNGITIDVMRSGAPVLSIVPSPIMSFEDLLNFASSVNDIGFNPANTFISAYFDFEDMFSPTGLLRLDGKREEQLLISIDDDLSDIDLIRAVAYGFDSGELL